MARQPGVIDRPKNFGNIKDVFGKERGPNHEPAVPFEDVQKAFAHKGCIFVPKQRRQAPEPIGQTLMTDPSARRRAIDGKIPQARLATVEIVSLLNQTGIGLARPGIAVGEAIRQISTVNPVPMIRLSCLAIHPTDPCGLSTSVDKPLRPVRRVTLVVIAHNYLDVVIPVILNGRQQLGCWSKIFRYAANRNAAWKFGDINFNVGKPPELKGDVKPDFGNIRGLSYPPKFGH